MQREADLKFRTEWYQITKKMYLDACNLVCEHRRISGCRGDKRQPEIRLR